MARSQRREWSRDREKRGRRKIGFGLPVVMLEIGFDHREKTAEPSRPKGPAMKPTRCFLAIGLALLFCLDFYFFLRY